MNSNQSCRHPGPTSARRAPLAELSELHRLLRRRGADAWSIGDLVAKLVNERGYTVKRLAELLQASRTRLNEMKLTAERFSVSERDDEWDFHFYTVAGRAARRLGIAPGKALKQVKKHQISSARDATRFLAQQIADRDNRRASASAAVVSAQGSGLIDHCHRNDFRNILPRLPDASIKLAIADPPYGQYGQYPDGRHNHDGTTRAAADHLDDESARHLLDALFRLALPKMQAGGCLVLFRPGAQPDPPWLLNAALEHGWACQHALTWFKKHIQPAAFHTAYSIASERLLIFAPANAPALVNHDNSSRSDILDFKPERPTSKDPDRQHLFRKPLALAEHLIRKHTYEGELVAEPFGGDGPFSAAAARLGRHWLYAESNHSNYRHGRDRIAAAVEQAQQASA